MSTLRSERGRDRLVLCYCYKRCTFGIGPPRKVTIRRRATHLAEDRADKLTAEQNSFPPSQFLLSAIDLNETAICASDSDDSTLSSAGDSDDQPLDEHESASQGTNASNKVLSWRDSQGSAQQLENPNAPLPAAHAGADGLDDVLYDPAPLNFDDPFGHGMDVDDSEEEVQADMIDLASPAPSSSPSTSSSSSSSGSDVRDPQELVADELPLFYGGDDDEFEDSSEEGSNGLDPDDEEPLDPEIAQDDQADRQPAPRSVHGQQLLDELIG
ncbi:unnamed protein product, partial [Tilletia caries]